MPISFGLAPGSCLLPESPPAPTTSWVYQLLVPSTGAVRKITPSIFLWVVGWLLEETLDVWSQLWWGPQVEL